MAKPKYIIKTVLTLTAIVAFIVTCVINALSASGGTEIFESTQTNLSAKYDTRITPAGWTFSIWGVIYAWQALHLLYGFILLFRKSSKNSPAICVYPDPVGSPFYITYTISCLCNIGWIFTFDRQLLVPAFIFLLAIAVSLYTSGILALRQLFVKAGPLMKREHLTKDIWLTRILVHNGVAFYCAWTNVASLLNLVIVLQYVNNVNDITCAWIALSILCVIVLLVFILEVFVFDNYARYVVAHYVTLVVALSGVYYKNNEPGMAYITFVIVLIALSAILGVVKLALAIYRGKAKPIEYRYEIEESTLSP